MDKQLGDAVNRETNALMDMYGLSRKEAQSHVKLGQHSSIKANSLGAFVWNDLQFKNAKSDLMASSNNRNLIGGGAATGSVPNFQARDAENPQTFNLNNIERLIDNTIEKLKFGVESILEQVQENTGNEQADQTLDIGPVKIDDASINALASQFNVSMEAQISRLIAVVREAAAGAGEGASASEIMGNIQHKLSVTHNGNISGAAGDVIKQIWPQIESYVQQQLTRTANGNPMQPRPPQNTGQGTQE